MKTITTHSPCYTWYIYKNYISKYTNIFLLNWNTFQWILGQFQFWFRHLTPYNIASPHCDQAEHRSMNIHIVKYFHIQPQRFSYTTFKYDSSTGTSHIQDLSLTDAIITGLWCWFNLDMSPRRYLLHFPQETPTNFPAKIFWPSLTLMHSQPLMMVTKENFPDEISKEPLVKNSTMIFKDNTTDISHEYQGLRPAALSTATLPCLLYYSQIFHIHCGQANPFIQPECWTGVT